MKSNPTVLLIIVLNISGLSVATGTKRYFTRLSSIAKANNFTSYSYDSLNRLAILDQVESYIKPIKSLDTRTYKSLNGLYDFCFDPGANAFASRWFDKELVDACNQLEPQNYYKMPVPSAFNDILTNATAKNYIGWMWYQTKLPLKIAFASKINNIDENYEHTWILQIENVNYLSLVWVQVVGDKEANFIGSHVGGHLPVTLDVSPVFNRKMDVEIRITIAVNNLLTAETIPSGSMINMTNAVGRMYYKFQPDFDFFHYAGIMGDVQIIQLPKYYVSTFELLTNNQTVVVEVQVCLNMPIEAPYFFTFSLWPQNSNETYHSVRKVDYSDNQDKCSYHIICESSSTCNFSLLDWPNTAVSKASRLGLHFLIGDYYPNISMQPQFEDIVSLNLVKRANLTQILDATTKQLQGFGMHHEQLFSGRTMSLASIMKDLYILKQMKANIIRTSHYPYSRAYLDACDELGLMVIAECPAVGLRSFSETKLTLHKQILLEMMQRDHDHPSIVMWSLANEPASQLPDSRSYFKSLVYYAKSNLRNFTIDTNRYLTVAIAQSHSDDKIGDLFDALMINRYYGWYECTGVIGCIRNSLLQSLSGWSTKYGSEKPILLSEFGADTLAGMHSFTSDIFSEEYQRDLIVEHELVFDELVRNKTSGNGQVNFLGAMVWNFADFNTHDSLLRVGGNKKGVLSKLREPKLAAETVSKIYQLRAQPNTCQPFHKHISSQTTCLAT